MTDVQGRCPACRGASLFLGSGGHVTCSRLDCPNPTAADDLMHGAGEEDGYDPHAVPTPGQWLRRFNQAPTEERLDVIARMLDASARAATCFEMNHEARLADYDTRVQQLEDLLRVAHETSNRVAHETSNRAERERAEAAQLSHRYRNDAQRAEAAIARVRAVADVIGSCTATWTGNEEEIARRIHAALDGEQPEPVPAATGHTYLSTGCLHGEHAYCQGRTGQAGAKRPATCKFCAAPCTCSCHTDTATPAATQATEPCTGQCDPTTGAFKHAVTCSEDRERTGRNAGLTIPAQPREHCGHLSPDTGLTTVRTECVLRPGHQGSHADDVGCRWWYDPTGDSSAPCTCGGRFPLQHLHASQHQPKEQR